MSVFNCQLFSKKINNYMYLQNKYTKWYYSIIYFAKNRTLSLSIYKERHHIIPKCIGGNNNTDNLVYLTAREHFICHLLLVKMVDGKFKSKLSYALWSMTNVKNKPQAVNRYKVNSKMYEHIKNIVKLNTSGANHCQAKTYKVTDPSGISYEIYYLKQFCAEHSFNYDHVLRLVREHREGRMGRLKGWSFIDINSEKLSIPLSPPKVYGYRKSYTLSSPSGESFTVTGGLEHFCKQHHLELSTIQKICKTGQPAARGSCVGWSIYEVIQS
jgi:hypothetical protein